MSRHQRHIEKLKDHLWEQRERRYEAVHPSTGMEWHNVVLHATEMAVLIPGPLDEGVSLFQEMQASGRIKWPQFVEGQS